MCQFNASFCANAHVGMSPEEENARVAELAQAAKAVVQAAAAAPKDSGIVGRRH